MPPGTETVKLSLVLSQTSVPKSPVHSGQQRKLKRAPPGRFSVGSAHVSLLLQQLYSEH